jgi:hypothetical protein
MLYPSELQARGWFVAKKAGLHFPAVILSLIGWARQQAR